jgi:hypothetical protein
MFESLVEHDHNNSTTINYLKYINVYILSDKNEIRNFRKRIENKKL